MAKYFLTKKAVEDLSKIWDYTYEAWSGNQADKYYELFISSFQEIVKNPALGKNYEEIHHSIRGLGVGKHIVFFRVAKNDNIEILRILHQKMDLKSKIGE